MPQGGWHPYNGVYRPQVVVRSYRDMVYPHPIFPELRGGAVSLGTSVALACASIGTSAVAAVSTVTELSSGSAVVSRGTISDRSVGSISADCVSAVNYIVTELE